MARPLKRVVVVLAAAALSLPLAARPQTPAAFEAVVRDLDAQLAADFSKDPVGGASIGVVSGDRLIWSKQYGFADMEAKRVATNDTDYRIGSVTKQFTALMLLRLVEQGKVHLSDPIEKYYPEIARVPKFQPDAPPITLLQVATMTSGLAREPAGMPDHSVGPVSDWEKKVIAAVPFLKYEFEPGTHYLYSNIGYASLGLALERVAGQPYTTYVAQHILQVLDMSRSGFEPTGEIRSNLAHGYTQVRSAGGAAVSRAGPDNELDGRGYRVPNGALFSTVNDLAKFVAWELGHGPGGLLKRETQDANYSRVATSTDARSLQLSGGYGVGFQAIRRGNLVFLGHGGSTSGFHASVLFHRESQLGVIVLCNSDFGSFDAGPVALRVLEAVVKAVPAR